MADSISIPGVSDKYKTNDLVQSLMEVERIPLKREQEALERFQKQQDAWREVNSRMSTLRTSVKTLYSFENPFNNKLASSSDENALTVDAGRDADFGSFKVEVLAAATADRFLSDSLDAEYNVPQGKYTFKVGDKTVDFSFKGGKVTDFVNALNRRGTDVVQARLIGVSSKKKALLIESLKTGVENSLILENDALTLAKNIKMVEDAVTDRIYLPSSTADFKKTKTQDVSPQEGMPDLSLANVTSDGQNISVAARGGFEVSLEKAAQKGSKPTLEFTFKTQDVEDITEELNKNNEPPKMPDAGKIEFEGLTVENAGAENTLPEEALKPREALIPIEDKNYFYIRNAYGIETEVESDAFTVNEEKGETFVRISLNDYPEAESLIVKNHSTGSTLTMTVPSAYDKTEDKGFVPSHPIAQAQDAVIRYEGITMNRSTNDIDDVVPHITLHVHDATEKPATITINPDKESAKDALINFVGNYNQVVSELNILTMDKPEVISELDYLSESERDAEKERLGMFLGDFSLTNGKNSLQRILTSPYRYDENTTVTQLSQIGISTSASSGNRSYSPSQMRGYLEIDEKKLDASLENDLGQIKNLFGYDSDGDRMIDSGIGFLLDKQLTSWVQSGGIINSKTTALESQIKNTNTRITKLETQLDAKEAELKRKYASMEGALNSLEAQSSSLNNFSNAGNNNRR